MDFLFQVDWPRLFVPKFSVLEILVRGVAVYILLCLLLRVVLKRQAGKVALSDLLVVTLVAGVCRNPLVADAYSIPDGLGVVAVVLGCSYLLDWLSYYSPSVHRLLHPQPVRLIRDGEVLWHNLRGELMTEQQLCCKLRQQGVADPAEVAEAWMEGEGQVSVVKKKPPPPPPAPGENGVVTGSCGAESSPGNRLAEPTAYANGTPGGEEPELRRFLEAARKVEERIRWHEGRVAEHAARVADLKGALARWGFRVKSPARPKRSGAGRADDGEGRPTAS